MKKIFTAMLFLTLVLGATSCSSSGSKNDDSVLKTDISVSDPEVYGENSDLYSIVPGTYTLKRDERLKIKVKLKLEQNPNGEIDHIGYNSPIMRLKDEDGLDVVDGWSQMKLADGEKARFENFLKKAPGTEQDFLFVNDFGYNKTEAAIEKTKSFTIEDLNIVFKDDTEKKSNSEESEELSESSKASKSEIDKFLDDYEKAVNKYVKDMEKAKKEGGLLDWANATTSMTVEITKLADKLDKYYDDMTMEQATRFANIQSKMSLATADSTMDMLF